MAWLTGTDRSVLGMGSGRTYSNMTLMSEESVFRQQNQLLPDSVAASSLILKSQFSFVSDGIDGTIVRLFCHTASFLAHNTTFSNSLFEEKTLLLFIEWGSLSASYTVLTSSFDLILRDNQFSSSKSDRNGGAVAVILDGSTNEECRLTVDIEHCISRIPQPVRGEGGRVFINVQGTQNAVGPLRFAPSPNSTIVPRQLVDASARLDQPRSVIR
ncbi:hypothetical protein BLNAU_18689 [Blattamonas nauphoetae]|uniref:Uncharacterized protein n=1 Tax=Blattamonas nauphoetae TaxID=2049346 RepID=A0ABQ9X3H8_9EUKA|nr:hypothetical protein BLNAU_18689 [Blattamonas nauphoetae]